MSEIEILKEKNMELIAEIDHLKAQVRLAGVSAEMTVHQAVGRAATDYLLVMHESDQLKAENEALRHSAEVLRYFVGAACTCSTEIDPRGYKWCEAYLDEALTSAREAMSREEQS